MIEASVPRGVSRLSQGTLTDKALAELARLQREFLEESVRIRERRGSWDRIALLFEMMDALSAELTTLCHVLGFLSPWVSQVRDGQPTTATLDGNLVDPGITSLWKWPTLREAIQFLDDQRVVSWTDFLSLSQENRLRAFAVPPMTKIETVQALKGAIVSSFARGESVETFKKAARQILNVQGAAIERTYRTKSKQAYLQGVDVLTKSPRVRDRFPWVKYVATDDNRTRPEHRAMDGKIARVGSPEHEEFKRLQSQYNCRCGMNLLTDAMAMRHGVNIDNPAGVSV